MNVSIFFQFIIKDKGAFMKSLQNCLLALIVLLLSSVVVNAQIGTPNLSAPINGATYGSTSPTLSWWYIASDYSPGPFNFSVEISTNSTDFSSSNLVYSTTISATGAGVYTVPQSAGLVTGITYYWRVGVDSKYSTVWSMTPSFGNTGPTGYTLNSSTIGNGTIDKNPNQSTYVNGTMVTLTATPDAGWTFSGWSGDAAGSNNPLSVTMNSNKNIIATFSSSTNPDQILVTPLNGAIDQALNLHFEWNAYPGAVEYNLQVSKSSNFTSFIIDSTKPASDVDALYHDASGLEELTTYYWKVTVTTGTSTVASDTWSFTTKAIAIPTAFDLLSPANNDRLSIDNTSFTWEKSKNSEGYNFVLVDYTNDPVLDTLINTSVTDPMYVVSSLPGSSTYKWDVTAFNSDANVSSANGPFTLTTGDTLYVNSTSGSDASGTTGSINDPFASIQSAYDEADAGSTIKIYSGFYTDLLTLDKPISLVGYGTTQPIVITIMITSSYVSISNLQVVAAIDSYPSISIQPSLNHGGGGISYLNDISINNINLVKIASSPDPMIGLFAFGVDNLTVKNSDFSGCQEHGVILSLCRKSYFDNITVTENAYDGMNITLCENSVFNNIVANNNGVIGNSKPHSGIALLENKDLIFNNIQAGYSEDDLPVTTVNDQDFGIAIGPNDNISFNNGNVLCNRNGVDITTNKNIILSEDLFMISNLFGSLRSLLGIANMVDVSNITFSGDFLMCHNSNYGLQISSTVDSAEVNSVSFNPGIQVKENGNNVSPAVQVNLREKVSDIVFDGVDIEDDTHNNFVGMYVEGNNLRQPENIKVNNTIFGGTESAGEYAIQLVNATKDVNAQNNFFIGTTDSASVDAIVLHKEDDANLGFVDFSGFSATFDPEITVESVSPAYIGATYLLDVNFRPKFDSYVLISGKFTYDADKLEYLGYLNNGLINDATWSYFSVSNTVEASKGIISFTGWGLTPITDMGKLFNLQMKVRSELTSPDTVAIKGNAVDFDALNTDGTSSDVVVNSGILDYGIPTGIISDNGDVTLDKIVDMDDFYLLLLYVGGNTSMITDAEALMNADFNKDGNIDLDDLNELYALINGTPSSPIVAGGGFNMANASLMPKDKLVQVPLELSNANDLYSLTVDFEYDPAIVNYQSFSSLYNTEGFTVLGYEKEQGSARFVFYANEKLNGNIEPGEIFLRVSNLEFSPTQIKSKYTLNGKTTLDGPTLTITTNGITDVKDEVIPTKFELCQNYPNPFNPSTIIRYSLPEPGLVTIKIYNILGQVVATLLNEQVNVGVHEVSWNGQNDFGSQVSAGMYIYRVTADKYTAVKKMLLLK